MQQSKSQPENGATEIFIDFRVEQMGAFRLGARRTPHGVRNPRKMP
jgi:hypothetical protein